MADEGAQQELVLLEPGAMMAGGSHHSRKIEGGEAGQGVGLQVAPDYLHWVELRSVGRKEEQVDAWGPLREPADRLAPMRS